VGGIVLKSSKFTRPAQFVFAVCLCTSSAVLAANHAKVTPRELARAIAQADHQSVPYLQGTISPSDIRVIRCVAPDEEPTEFECAWQQRTRAGWVKRQTWLAIDGTGWHVID
jgi:hypothetical protein